MGYRNERPCCAVQSDEEERSTHGCNGRRGSVQPETTVPAHLTGAIAFSWISGACQTSTTSPNLRELNDDPIISY